MIIKPYDLSDAVTYHIGTFPPSALDYEVLLGPLEEAAASLARYDTKMSGMVNSELLAAVLAVIYLIFNEGYRASQGDDLIRHDLCAEAIRLGTLLNRLLADEPAQTHHAEAMGLLALMLLHHARRDARLSQAGELLTLEEQDRRLWHQTEIQAGINLLDKAMARRQPGPYQIQPPLPRYTSKLPLLRPPTGPRLPPCMVRSTAYNPPPSSPSTGRWRSPWPRGHWPGYTCLTN